MEKWHFYNYEWMRQKFLFSQPDPPNNPKYTPVNQQLVWLRRVSSCRRYSEVKFNSKVQLSSETQPAYKYRAENLFYDHLVSLLSFLCICCVHFKFLFNKKQTKQNWVVKLLFFFPNSLRTFCLAFIQFIMN